MRDYLLAVFLLASVPVGLVRPFYGLLVYAWVSYMYPQMYMWSFAQYLPGAKLMAGATIAGAVIKGDIDVAPLRRPEMVAMMLLLLCFSVSTVLSTNPELAWPKWQEVSKVVVMGLVSSVFLTTQRRLRLFLIVVAFSLGFYGVKGGLFSVITGGTNMVGGAGTSVLAANNAIGLALNMALPLMWYLAQEEQGWMKRFLQTGFFLTIPAVMFTYSRASAITLGAILTVLLFRSRRRFLLIAVLAVGGLVAIPRIPDKWWDRQETTLTYEEDGSAMSRIDVWKMSWRIAWDNPLAGVGFEFQTNELFEKYDPEYITHYGRKYNTHSIYFAILTSHGFPSFLVFSAMIGLTYTTCRRVRRRVRGHPELKWCGTYCHIVTVGLLAFLINGAFVNMEYFDLPYHFVAVAACLSVMCERALAAESNVTIKVTDRLSPAAAF
jgi:putative inorganic carbon (hco3(-)) transporter